MEAIVLVNGDILIVNGSWIVLRWGKEKNRINRIASNDGIPAGWWQEAIKCLEAKKKEIE